MIFLYIANAIITVLTGTLLFVYTNLDSAAVILNIIFLLITLEIPTIYLLLAMRKKLDRNDNELLVPSLLLTIPIFLIDLIFYSVCVGIHTDNLKLFILYTIIFHCIASSLLLIVKGLTNYIRKQHK